MSGIAFQVIYNPRTYRWELWRSGDRLPWLTHVSKDFTVMTALSLVRTERPGRILLYNEKGSPETILEAWDYNVSRSASFRTHRAAGRVRACRA